jgi:copper resistance protein B
MHRAWSPIAAISAIALCFSTLAIAQTAPAADMSGMPGMDMPAPRKPGVEQTPAHDSAKGAEASSMQGGRAPVDARDPDAYADGLHNDHMPGMDMVDDAGHVYVLLDRFEQFNGRHGNGQALDGQAWIGGDIDKLWLKVDGERFGRRLASTRTELLWDRAVATYWGLQAGVRHDFAEGPGRTWAAFGVQGLSPYWFDLQATAYVGEGGRTALRFEGDYELRITQRLVLQPNLKVSAYGKGDIARRIGSGLSDVDAGLRLRYEFSRKFAPYLGVTWNRKFGGTADIARNSGDVVQDTRVVAGVRLWF